MPQREPTLRDVAVRTGLSVTTVSQVLSDAPGRRIAEPTRRRVRAAAAELSYRPNRLAQGLRLKRTQTLGFVSDWIGASPYAGLTIVGAQDAAAEQGYLLMLMLMTSGKDSASKIERSVRFRISRLTDSFTLRNITASSLCRQHSANHLRCSSMRQPPTNEFRVSCPTRRAGR